MSESLLTAHGAPPSQKQYKKTPITESMFFSGLWTQRSPFGSPDSRYYRRILGGRTDILIDGLNTELTNYGTLIRRPGFNSFSSAILDSGALSFYSFHPIGNNITVMADSQTKVYTLTSTTATSIFTKSMGAGQTYFQGVGTTLYMGNGVDQKAFPNNGTTRNWGIALAGGGSSVLNTAGTGADSGGGSFTWSNPGNVSSAVSYATCSVITRNIFGSWIGISDELQATNFGFGLASTFIVGGIQVNFDFFLNLNVANISTLYVQLLKNGSPIGSLKSIVVSNTSVQTITLGNSSDLWGSSFTFNDINSSTFGVQIQGQLNAGGMVGDVFNVRNVQITAFPQSTSPTVTLVAGTLTGTYQYIYAYYNSASGDVSNPTTPSAVIMPSSQGVQVSLVASTDPQVTGIRVFRTKTGGSTFFELPTSPYFNATQNITDNAADSALQTQNFFPSFTTWFANSPPPSGLVKMAYHLNRMWGIVNNNVYFSALLGDDITLGVGVECWPPANVFVFPEPVNRLMPIASGLLVFTTDDIWIITGTSRTGTTGPLLTSQLFQQGVGLLNWNALDVEGNQVFLYTADKQFISFTASGPSEIGFPIGVDLQNTFDPTKVYVASLIAGTQDKAVFVADGSSNWYRCNWNQPPEGGPAWSPKATITGGFTSAVAVETSPGVHQLLIGQSNGAVLVRSYSTFSDNGTSYSGFATIGSLVLAKPGQLALLDSIVLELQKVGTVPNVAVMLDEISGNNFETLPAPVNDPPRLSASPSATLYSKRWYVAPGNIPAPCRHIQLRINFATEAAKNEILTVTTIGSLTSDE